MAERAFLSFFCGACDGERKKAKQKMSRKVENGGGKPPPLLSVCHTTGLIPADLCCDLQRSIERRPGKRSANG